MESIFERNDIFIRLTKATSWLWITQKYIQQTILVGSTPLFRISFTSIRRARTALALYLQAARALRAIRVNSEYHSLLISVA